MGIPKLTNRWTAPSTPPMNPRFSTGVDLRKVFLEAPEDLSAEDVQSHLDALGLFLGGNKTQGTYVLKIFEDLKYGLYYNYMWRDLHTRYVWNMIWYLFAVWKETCTTIYAYCMYIRVHSPFFLFVRVEQNWQPHWILWTWIPKPGIQAQDLHKRSCAFQLQIDEDITTWNVDLFYQRNTWRNIYTVYTYIETVSIYINNQ